MATQNALMVLPPNLLFGIAGVFVKPRNIVDRKFLAESYKPTLAVFISTSPQFTRALLGEKSGPASSIKGEMPIVEMVNAANLPHIDRIGRQAPRKTEAPKRSPFRNILPRGPSA